jgi:hypothetical protein
LIFCSKCDKILVTKEENKMDNKDNILDIQKILEEKFEEIFGVK